MGDRTEIAWADVTWNPVTGCRRVSTGCDNCYIERTPPFRMTLTDLLPGLAEKIDTRGGFPQSSHTARKAVAEALGAVA